MPTVSSVEEAHELVATHEENPDLVLEELPFAEHEQLVAARSGAGSGATIAAPSA